MQKSLTLLIIMAVLLVATPAAFGQFAATGTTNLTVTVGPEAAITVAGTTPLITAGLFADYTGATAFTYKIRTTASGGTGSITAQVTTDFAPAGGPLASAGVLTYGCTVSAPGTACTGPVTAGATSTNIATFGANARSARVGNDGSLAWALVNDPQYQTGSYQATVTLSISAL